MARLGILNMALGFTILFLAAAAGAFISFDLTQAYLHDLSQLDSWQMTLLKSSHGHSNLFGMLHIALGLTLPYSPLSYRYKLAQTLSLAAGTLAMGPLMIVRAMSGPSDSFDVIGLTIGAGLSLALLALASQAAALFYKLLRA